MTKKTTAKKSSTKAAKTTKSVKKDKSKNMKSTSKSSKPQKKSVAAPSKKKKEAAPKKTTLTEREAVIQRIRQDLLNQRESLLKEAEETLSSLPSELNFPDMGDQATAEADRNFMLRLRDRERMLLKKIEETIERIENGPYGICDECGNEIGIKRLEARPVTTLCIDCKTRQEEEERIAEGG
ncbi:MAG: RNA polymerase-binding protein DksA [Nitrospirota bacterium]